MTDGFFSRRARNYEKENKWILSPEFIEPLVPAVFGGGNMLDVCAGTGVIPEYACSIGWKATALDSNADMLQGVDPAIQILLDDAHHMPFSDNTFDLVTCRQGIQYLRFEDAIREMLRVSSNQVRMLHGFIIREDIPLWQHLFELAQGPKRNFFSSDMLDAAIACCPHSSLEHGFLKSRERFVKPEHVRAEIDSFLQTHPAFTAKYRVENSEDKFTYDLNWVLHIIKKA